MCSVPETSGVKTKVIQILLFLYDGNLLNLLLIVFCIILYRVLLFLWSDGDVPKSEVPEKNEGETSSSCLSQKCKLELPKTEVSKEISNVRAPTAPGVVPSLPLELDPEFGRYR